MKKVKTKRKKKIYSTSTLRKKYLHWVQAGLSPSEIMKRDGISRRKLEKILEGTQAFRKQEAKQRKIEYKNYYASMRNFADYLERIPLLKEMRQEGISQKMAQKIQVKLRKEGFSTNRIPYHSDEILLKDLRRVQRLIKRIPVRKDIDKHSHYSMQTYYRRFGSIDNIRRAAGIKTGRVKSS